jgi:membrane protein implicated in regulation of membrane protease activity
MFRFNISRLGWRGYVGLALAIAVGLALLVLSFGIALILLPIVAVALLIGRWRLGKMRAETPPRPDAPGRIIEVEYSVIEDREKR